MRFFFTSLALFVFSTALRTECAQRTLIFRPVSELSHSSRQTSWVNSAFTIASLLCAETAAQKLYKQSRYFTRNIGFSCFGMAIFAGTGFTARHATSLRVLLLIGGVEPNPGPVNLQAQTKEILTTMLRLFHDDDPEFVVPATKTEIIASLEAESQNANVLQLAYVQALVTMTANAPPPLPPGPPTVTNAHPGSAGIKLPTFNTKNPRSWFDQVEQILGTVSNDLKKRSVLRAVDNSYVHESGVNLAADYAEIKDCLICYYADSDNRRLRKLLAEQDLKGRKPTSALRELLELAPNHTDLVRLRFLEILPERIRLTLVSMDTVPLEQLAKIADTMLEMADPTAANFASASSHSSKSQSLTSWQTGIERKLEDLADAVKALTAQPGAGHSRGRGFSRNRSRGRSQSQNRGRLCRYHFKFGDDARNCVKPCSWDNSKSSSPGRNQGNE